MSEFVEGYERMSAFGPCISIFGSARTSPEHPVYKQTVEIAEAVAKSGYGVISGGGPGIMEAANKGAHQAGGVSVGLNIKLPYEQKSNPYIDQDKLIDFQYFFVRKVMFVKYAQGFIIELGAYGVPESFLVYQNKIIQKYVGPLNQNLLTEIINLIK